METDEEKSSNELSSPFSALRITSAEFLDDVNERSICGKCFKSRKYFCYTCHIPMEVIQDKIPKIKLPLQIDIIKYPKEIDGKSTASHAAILAPENVHIYNFPQIPSFSHKSKVLIVFPGKKAITLDDVAAKIRTKNAEIHLKENDDEKSVNVLGESETQSSTRFVSSDLEKHKDILKTTFPFERIIFIDSTWNQVQKINNDVRLEGAVDEKCIQRIELKTRESNFWRYQRGKPHTYLSTIEAIYYFLVDVHCIFVDHNYKGEYDNLLFFFRFMYKKIHTLYDHKELRAYTMRNNGIKMKGKFNF